MRGHRLAKLSETTGFMTAIQDQVFSTNDCKKHVLEDPNITNGLCRKCREKLGTTQHITSACHALAQDDYSHRPSRIDYQMWTVKGTINAVL
jgi:hypothetical protein